MFKEEKGKRWEPEWMRFRDRKTGVSILQLTNYMAHSYHIYFTRNGWYDQNRKLVFASDRGNRANLFSMDLLSGEITQLTDLKPGAIETDFQATCLNPVRSEAYFWYNRKLIALDLFSLQERELYEISEEFTAGGIACTADGQYVCVCMNEDLSYQIETDLSRGYIGFEETWALHPVSRILKISIDSGEAQQLHQDKVWIGSLNASPTQPDLLVFCHEGPWELVDHRIWGINLMSNEIWKIRTPNNSEEYVGHEFWHADGIHIGYHGFRGSLESKDKFFGRIRFDNTNCEDIDFPYQNIHVHSNDFDHVVGDGQQASAYHGDRSTATIRLWKRTEDGFIGPRKLCEHRGSFHVQKTHVHPRFSPDNKKILFTSDMSGYGNLYLVDVPEFDSLPEMVGVD
ncbi:MAG: Oligogalacturonide lyase [Bacilli bacterium]|nr:Oligogalacturonide lyase [Bacilli bacterium]